MTSRWRSASARIFSDSAAPVRAQLVGDALALRLHALVDLARSRPAAARRAAGARRRSRRRSTCASSFAFCRVAAMILSRSAEIDVVHGALVELLGAGWRCTVCASRAGAPLPRRRCTLTVVLAHVGDAPLARTKSTSSGLLLRRDDAVGLGVVERQDALVVEAHVLHAAAASKYRPGSVLTSTISPSWNLIAYLRWSTVYSDCDATQQQRDDAARGRSTVRFIARSPGRGCAALRASARIARTAASAPVGGVAWRARRRSGAGAAAVLRRRLCWISLSSGRYSRLLAALLVDQDLARVAEHRLHHVEIQAVARHRRAPSLYSTRICAEARRVALGALRRRSALVAVRLLDQPRRRAARARHDVVGVGLAFVLLALAVLRRPSPRRRTRPAPARAAARSAASPCCT